MMKKTLIIILLAASIFSGIVQAAPVQIKARLDSTRMLMGTLNTLHLEVVKDRNASGYLPVFNDDGNRPFVSVLGDTVELSRKFRSDTLDLGAGRVQINFHILLQAFDSGAYLLPAFEYVAGIDTARSNRTMLKVLPVAVKDGDEIAGYSGVVDPEQGSWTDNLPDWVVNYWWLLALILLLIVATIFGYIYYKKNGRLTPKPKKVPTPWEKAMAALDDLRSQQLWQNGLTDEYFVKLTQILRTYIDGRFHVSAPEMTSQQFLMEASRNPKLTPYAPQLERLLELADFVKFARRSSLPDENTEAMAVVRDFIEQTKPTPEEIAALKEAAEQAMATTRNGKTFPTRKKTSNKKGKKSNKEKNNKKGGKR